MLLRESIQQNYRNCLISISIKLIRTVTISVLEKKYKINKAHNFNTITIIYNKIIQTIGFDFNRI